MPKLKLFIVTKTSYPPEGPSEIRWTRYYIAHTEETVWAIFRDEGDLARYYCPHLKAQVVTRIEEQMVTFL
jgi:hypothetical protein